MEPNSVVTFWKFTAAGTEAEAEECSASHPPK
ncbi:hypothetical protein V6Z11_D08G128000 [Gossypium hirsutum]|uniref:Uncharacterized protein n=1 Tax=Gossypium tomentosum TaxID=34277 RepID=A0A5D2JUU2_GOSTO|nr:hypothetical protein ES332_D08G138200v1 [Gossypium tomentosum]